jgi:hypothetical protein
MSSEVCKGTADLKFTYKRKEEEPKLKGYVDADFAGCIDTSRSTSGWIFFLGGTAICWQSKRHTAVTLSTCEAEYMAMGLATKEALFLKEFMEELFCFEKIESVKLYCDSQSAIKLLKNPVLHQTTKNIRVQAHFIRERVKRKDIRVFYINTKEQKADFLTKAVSREVLEFCRKEVGLK